MSLSSSSPRSTSTTGVTRTPPSMRMTTLGEPLAPSGSESAGCKGSGYGSQVSGRAVECEGVHASTYSCYMPKDETLPGLGHLHDWEACVVWLDSLDSQNVVALSASAHSGYNEYYPPSSSYFDGDSSKIEYSSSYGVIDHSYFHCRGTEVYTTADVKRTNDEQILGEMNLISSVKMCREAGWQAWSLRTESAYVPKSAFWQWDPVVAVKAITFRCHPYHLTPGLWRVRASTAAATARSHHPVIPDRHVNDMAGIEHHAAEPATGETKELLRLP
ncbi:hypothetical protein ON010_g15508 [Phytophthora cinnamomi]|nr:hypothetical protein ON010_g15508 [Phytophthora cinnamomi]